MRPRAQARCACVPTAPPPGQNMDEIWTMWVIFVEMNILLHTVSLVYSLGRLPRPPFCPAATFFGSHISHVLMARSRSKLRREHVRSPCPSHAPPRAVFPICVRCHPRWARSTLMALTNPENLLASSTVPGVARYGPRGAGVANAAILQP